MRKLSIILLLFASSFNLNAQITRMNLAVKKPRVPDTYNFVYTGALQQFIVPNRVTAIQVK